ncbi:MAG TPA: hypothetical protein VH331_18745 [Allosphingosinicella sp.]|jgi:hypothetical protein|nr:hypothetical protein [Allosphingosinicella sp.]
MSSAARTYNQAHAPRPADGRRRLSIYWSWSYPWEAQRDPALMENRFSTFTEVRNVLWPAYEKPVFRAERFLQGIAGTLELFHISTLSFQRVAEEVTGHRVPVFQRVDQAGFSLPIDERVLADCDTLLVFGLDHLPSEQKAHSSEVDALKEWLKQEGNCLLLAPHHDVGFTDSIEQRREEYAHHGDALVPREQGFGTYIRDLMQALDVPVRNIWGLRPAQQDGDIAPLTKFPGLDERGLLEGVSTLNFHPHLPHYQVSEGHADRIRVLARQPVEMSRPHPFTAAGDTEFNIVLWMPPEGERKGDVVLVDSTHFTTLFGGTKSLERFWRNLGEMPGGRFLPRHKVEMMPRAS